MVDYLFNWWHILGAECLHEDVNGGGVLNFVDLVGPSGHNHIFVLVDHVHLLFLFVLLLLVFILLVIILIRLKDELLSPVVGGNLLELSIPLKLLRSTQHFHVLILFLAALVLLEVGLLWHFVELYFSLHPRVAVYLLPRYSAISLLCK